MGMGIGAGFGAAGAVQGLQQLIAQRQMMRAYADQQQQQAIQNQDRQQALGLQARGLDQQDQQRGDALAELTRQHDLAAAHQTSEDTMKAADVIPPGAQMPFANQTADRLGTMGLTKDVGVTPEAPPSSLAAPGAPAETPLAGTINNAPNPMGRLVTKLASAKQLDTQADNDRAAKAIEEQANRDKEIGRHNKAMENKPAAVSTVTIQTQDDQGNNVTRVIPKSEAIGKTYKKGVSGATETRLASAQAVNQTGDDIIKKLSDPNVAKQLGPAMGRYNSVREWIGDPPPELAELAGAIESYAIANMGVHGMRSVQGAEQIKKLLDKKHTPESLAATIKGLSQFSQHFMQNEGRGGAATAQPAAGGSGIKSITEIK